MKIFKTNSKEVAIYVAWRCSTACPLPSVSVNNERSKFVLKFSVSEYIYIYIYIYGIYS